MTIFIRSSYLVSWREVLAAILFGLVWFVGLRFDAGIEIEIELATRNSPKRNQVASQSNKTISSHTCCIRRALWACLLDAYLQLPVQVPNLLRLEQRLVPPMRDYHYDSGSSVGLAVGLSSCLGTCSGTQLKEADTRTGDGRELELQLELELQSEQHHRVAAPNPKWSSQVHNLV